MMNIWVELSPSPSKKKKKKKSDVHYLNFSVSIAVFPTREFELQLFLLCDSVPRHHGWRLCVVYLGRKKWYLRTRAKANRMCENHIVQFNRNI